MDIPFSQDIKDFFQLLQKHDVRYLLIGGYAVSIHAKPRYTKDVDVWFEQEQANIQNLLKALDDFGFTSLGLQEADFLDKDVVIQLGYEPNRIDLIATDSLNFAQAHRQRIEVQLGDIDIAVIGIDELISLKLSAGRDQDIVDAKLLEEFKNAT